jgi:short subunit fatty acids transporter
MGLRGILLRFINVLFLVAAGFIGLDALFQLLSANPAHPIVAVVDRVAGRLLVPFEGMFPQQNFWITALIAIVVYWLLAALASAVVRMLPAGRRLERSPERARRRRWMTRRSVRAEDRR